MPKKAAAKRSAGRIYVPELNQSFESTAEAAQILGIDASNIAKVLRGKRKSAGGFSFVRNPSYAKIKELQKQQESIKAAEGIKPGKAAAKAKQSREAAQLRRDTLDKVHKQLVVLNKQLKAKKKAGVYDTDEDFKKLMAHAQYFGYNKQGGYNTALQNLRQFTTTELQNLLTMINQEQKAAVQNDTAARNLASFALQFGVTDNEFKKYMHLVPLMTEIFNLAHGVDNYDLTRDTIYEAVQDNEDPAKLQAFLLDAKKALQGNSYEDLQTIIGNFTDTGYTDVSFWDTYGE